jgi:hemerythrin
VALVEWSESLTSGEDDLDAHHEEIFRYMHKLDEACEEGRARKEIESTIQYLKRYVDFHFTYEEQLMEKFEYPETEAHAGQHHDFAERVRGLDELFGELSTSLGVLVETNHALSNWLKDHILETDVRFIEYMRERRAAADEED